MLGSSDQERRGHVLACQTRRGRDALRGGPGLPGPCGRAPRPLVLSALRGKGLGIGGRELMSAAPPAEMLPAGRAPGPEVAALVRQPPELI